jgi:hypothetical protein
VKAIDSYLGTQLSPHKVRSETDGSLICRAVVARSGFQSYALRELDPSSGSDEMVDVYRPPEEVISPEFIASLEGATITDGHPGRFVSPETHSWVSRGFAVNVARGPDDADGNVTLMADLHLKDSSIIAQVEAGKKQLSVGYLYVISDEAGRYVMRQLRANHIAVVETARAGDVAQITDSAPSIRARIAAIMRHVFPRKAADTDTSEGFIRSENKESPIFDPRRRQENVDEDVIGSEEKHMDNDKVAEALASQTKVMERLCELMDRMKSNPAQDAECNCGGTKYHGDNCPLFKGKAEDMDENFSDRRQKPDTFGVSVIPVNGNGGEGNVNPVRAHDYEEALNNLRGIRSIVAKSGDTAAIRAYNRAVTDVKRRLQDALMNPPIVRQASDDVRERVRADGMDYEQMCKALHRQPVPNAGADTSDYIQRCRQRAAHDEKPKPESYEEIILRARKKALESN